MIAGWSMLRQRYLHLSVNVLKELKFSDVETEMILKTVNNSSAEELTNRFAISAARARELELERQRTGENVNSIDQLSSIGGFNASILTRFCKSILNNENADGGATQGDETVQSTTRKKKGLFTFPPMSYNLTKQIKSFTSIHCVMTGLSWSTFAITSGERTKLTDWKWKPMPEKKLNLHELATFMTNSLKELPQSDFYVFENPASPNVAPKVNLNIQINQMVGIASAIAAQNNPFSNGGDANAINVAYMRQFLFARLFKLYVGSERVSTVDSVERLIRASNVSNVAALIDDSIETDESLVDVNDALKSMYSVSRATEKDVLGCSFLLGLAFLRLCLLKCPHSLKLVQR